MKTYIGVVIALRFKDGSETPELGCILHSGQWNSTEEAKAAVVDYGLRAMPRGEWEQHMGTAHEIDPRTGKKTEPNKRLIGKLKDWLTPKDIE